MPASHHFQRSRLDVAREVQALPRGLVRGADPSMVVSGVVVEVDRATNRVKVAINGGAGSWMSALAARYIVGRTVFVVRNPLRGGSAEWCAGPVFPVSYPARTSLIPSVVNTSARTATVTYEGVAYVLPYVTGPTYTTAAATWVLVNPFDGVPYLIAGLATNPPVDPVPTEPEDVEDVPPPPPPPPSTVTRTVTITPSWSGTHRSGSTWDRWNTNRYGGRSTLYQGASFGSGTLKGLAAYGNQIKNLNAIEITSMKLTLRGAGLALGSYPNIEVQGSPHGSKPGGSPSSSGSTVTGDPGKTGKDVVTIPGGLYTDFADGTLKGICLVGSGYNAVRGTSAADGMALKITYTTAN